MASAASLLLGLLFSSLFVLARADQQLAGAAALDSFEAALRAVTEQTPDQRLWSEQRVEAWHDAGAAAPPPGVLSIPSIGLTAPIFPGTDELTLNRGVGWIENTAAPGAGGNVGLAGHRDGFFRGLKDLGIDDAIDMLTTQGVQRYRVEEILIVDPTDTWVLEATDQASLTLVTCYPFYFIGPAPKRYIVKAVFDPAST